MTGNIYRAANIDLKNFTFEEPEINKYGGKSCSVKYKGNPFYIQTPRCRLPYCLGKYDDPQGGRTKYSLDFSLGGYELDEGGDAVNPRMREFYEWAESMEKLLVETAHKNAESWLEMPDATEGVAKALVRPLLKWSKDKVTKKTTTKWPPTIKGKVGHWDGRFTLNAFNEKKERVEDLDAEIIPRTEGIGILKLMSVTFAGGKVGYSFQVHQLKLYAPQGMPAYAFMEDEEDDKPVVTGGQLQDEEADADEDAAPAQNNTVDDSDDDDEDSDDDDNDDLDNESEGEAEPEPVKPSPKKKKVIRRKKKTSD
jgi:hypothetical protein